MLLQVQHRGLMAMMNAFDVSSSSSLLASSIAANTQMNRMTKPSHPQSNKSGKVNSRHQRRRNDAANVADSLELPVAVSVTPVLNEGQSLYNCSQSPDVKITSKEYVEGRVQERNNSNIRGALVELQQLRESFRNQRFLRVPPRSAAAPDGKENQAMGPSAAGERQFATLIESLRKMNPELGAGRGRSVLPEVSPTRFRLLRLPSPPRQEFPVKFPGVISSPRPAWNSVDRQPPRENCQPLPPAAGEQFRQLQPTGDDFPLLHLSEEHFPSHGRDTEFTNGLLPFPMLQMVDPLYRPVPFFVPPESIVGRNNNNRETSTARSDQPTARSEPQTVQSNVAGSSQLSIRLLRLEPCPCKAEEAAENHSDSRQV